MSEAAAFWTDAASGTALDHAAALARMAAARLVLLGERHDRAADHRWQAQVVAGLAALRSELVVGFEMFPRRSQPALDAWVAGEMTEAQFLEASGWREVWGFDPALYRPLFQVCRDLRLPMRALNVDRPVVSAVARDGWAAVPEADRDWLSEAAPASAAYRRYLFDVTGGARPDRTAKCPEDRAFDRFVRAQQVWDRAFACGLHGALAGRPGVCGIGIIGRGHLEHRFGMEAQLAALGVGPVCVALPGSVGLVSGEGLPPIADLVFEPAQGD